ncbi:aminopeptidase Ey-like [Hemitrygon akajei]|uniref:aminopeptidase Ey-like n=1 Tax=Hemitrygon akajei TaxID=2704970 RepID=UPI003BFA2085
MMQPANARRVFPCFDEPALKATFDLTVIHRPQYTAISNMPVRMTSEMWVHGQLWIVTRFHRTPLMSSYLLACVVSDFPSIENLDGSLQVRVWARKQAMEAGQGDYALRTVGRLLHFYEEKFQIFYPLKKLDLVAVPCFENGGMENWGLVIFREINLLFQPQEDSESTRQELQLVLAHELVHQWFGNLVTIKWWNDLWLNEGFATYFSYLGNAFISPEWPVVSVHAQRHRGTTVCSRVRVATTQDGGRMVPGLEVPSESYWQESASGFPFLDPGRYPKMSRLATIETIASSPPPKSLGRGVPVPSQLHRISPRVVGTVGAGATLGAAGEGRLAGTDTVDHGLLRGAGQLVLSLRRS